MFSLSQKKRRKEIETTAKKRKKTRDKNKKKKKKKSETCLKHMNENKMMHGNKEKQDTATQVACGWADHRDSDEGV